MSVSVSHQEQPYVTANAAAITTLPAPSLPIRKRKTHDESLVWSTQIPASTPSLTLPQTNAYSSSIQEKSKPIKRTGVSVAKEKRLEQNRRAARESRRRKKAMIEELHRSVSFFSRANGAIKQRNEELSRMLMRAQAQVAAIEKGEQAAPISVNQSPDPMPTVKVPAPAPTPSVAVFTPKISEPEDRRKNMIQQAEAQLVATQAMYESQGFPTAAARAAAQTMNAAVGSEAPNFTVEATATIPSSTELSISDVQANAPSSPNAKVAPPSPEVKTSNDTQSQIVAQSPLVSMQPCATMQAMANFHQAAADAMKAAAMAMQQAAGQQHPTLPTGSSLMATYPMLAWSGPVASDQKFPNEAANMLTQLAQVTPPKSG